MKKYYIIILEVKGMKEVYIKKTDVNKWIGKYFEKQDLISVDDLISCIENLDDKIDYLEEKIRNLEEVEESFGGYEYGE